MMTDSSTPYSIRALTSHLCSLSAFARPRSIRDWETAVARYCQIGITNSGWDLVCATTVGSNVTSLNAASKVFRDTPRAAASGHRSSMNFTNSGSARESDASAKAVMSMATLARTMMANRPKGYFRITDPADTVVAPPTSRVGPLTFQRIFDRSSVYSELLMSSGRGIEITLNPESTK